jgi:hypothetical protein
MELGICDIHRNQFPCTLHPKRGEVGLQIHYLPSMRKVLPLLM